MIFFLLKNLDFNLWGFLRRNLVLICSKEQRLIDDDIYYTISTFLAHYLHQLVRKIISMYLLIKKFKKTFLKIDGWRFFFSAKLFQLSGSNLTVCPSLVKKCQVRATNQTEIYEMLWADGLNEAWFFFCS